MKRIQRKRTAGWRAPVNTLNVTRPGRHGNPYPVDDMGLGVSLLRFRIYLDDMAHDEPEKYSALIEAVRDADYVMCWCPVDQECHGDIWIDRAMA